MILEGYGPNQPKPEKNVLGKTTLDIAPDLDLTKEQAAELLRSQKIPAAQKDVVSDFYKQLAPDRRKPDEKK